MQNRRSKMTKVLLNQALIELLLEKDITKISIRELTDKADVNRSTYYSHYTDIYHQLTQITEEFMSQYPFAENRYSPSTEELKNTLKYIVDHKKVCIALIKTGKYHEYMIQKSIAIFDEGNLQKGKMKKVNRDVYLAQVIYTICGSENVLLEYLEGNLNLNVDQIAYLMNEMNTFAETMVYQIK